MNRVATCPKCKTEYELDEDDIGHVMECECGAALFACHTRSLNIFEIWCKDCGSGHPVPGVEVGRTIELECGKAVCVPSVMLRLPVGNRELAARAHAQWKQQGKSVPRGQTVDSQSNGDPTIASSAIGAGGGRKNVGGHRNAAGDQGATAGSSVDTLTQPSVLISRSEDQSPHASGNLEMRGKERELASEFGGERKKKPVVPKRNLGSTLGAVAVATFLVVAVVMFLSREAPNRKRANRAGLVRQSPASNRTQAESNLELQRRMVIAGDRINPASDDLGLTRLPIIKVVSPPLVDGVGANSGSGSYRVPPPTIYALPEQKKPRDRIIVQKSKLLFSSLQNAMEVAFEKYGEVQKLKEQADVSASQADMGAYRDSVGRTIGVIEQVHELAVAKSAEKETATTRYLLAFLYLKAGMLPEAAVMGEAVVRWGEVDDPSTKEAGMIALAATQELSDLHWGQAEDLGELRHMEQVASILNRRWRGDIQNDLIWMNIGYLYEAFNQPENAVRVYENIPPSSEHYGTAGLASGMAEWNVLRRQRAATGNEIDADARMRVHQRLTRSLRLVEKKDSELKVNHVEARIALAQLDLIGGNPEKAEHWITVDPPALSSSIRVRENDEDESKLFVDEEAARQLYDVLVHARKEQGDTKGAMQAIDELELLVGDAGDGVAPERISILKAAFEKLRRNDEMHQAEFEAAQAVSDRIMNDSSVVPTATIFWLGESWAQVGDQALSGGQVGQDRLVKEASMMAANLFDLAIKRNDFPQESLQSAQLRRVELLRRSGEVMQALKQIEDMLAYEPKVFALQIAAAQCLQQVAVEYERSSDLLSAIEGPSGFSPIWGWAKLVTTLHTLVYSASGTDHNAEQLALAQYNLFWCRYQLASQIQEEGERMRQVGKVEQALSRRIATMDKSSDWYPKYKILFDQMSGGK